MEVQYFKATKQTHRFNKNQRVWIRLHSGNSLYIWFKWRGSGRYATGIIGTNHPSVGEIKTIEVSDDFARNIKGSETFYDEGYPGHEDRQASRYR